MGMEYVMDVGGIRAIFMRMEYLASGSTGYAEGSSHEDGLRRISNHRQGLFHACMSCIHVIHAWYCFLVSLRTMRLHRHSSQVYVHHWEENIKL